MENILEIRNLNVYYGVIHAIKDVSFTVRQGETVLVPFACGKYEIEPLGAGPASAVRVTL